MSRRAIIGIACATFVLALNCRVSAQELGIAASLYQRTDYAGALRVLATAKSPDAPAYVLIGKSRLMSGDIQRAIEAFQKAADISPADPEPVLWLGRSWGRRAETANPFSAAVDAVKARDYFEKAIAMDPNNKDALGDLFDYYLEAPALLGGGLDKAQALAAKIAQIDPPEGHSALARIARNRKNLAEAERQLRISVNLSPNLVGHILALASVLADEGRDAECQEVLASADRIAPGSPRVLYARADIYVKRQRNLDQARELLRKYVQSDLSPDDPPREVAEKLLRRINGS
jgi:tetratricopeptide (TPR) repeat protein